MRETTINEILGNFGSVESTDGARLKSSVTIWLTADAKARYDRLQEKSGRQFAKKARETLIALIELAEAKTA
jgi:cytidylate kinase